MNHRFFTLDVFTTTRFQGNPLAVITDGDGLSNDQMLAIAREMNLSETVFVQKPSDDRALARLRIFTTKEELKLAGHPVIGTWFLLAELGVVPAPGIALRRVYLPHGTKQTQMLTGSPQQQAAQLVEKLKHEVRVI